MSAAERNVRECALGQQNQNENWGGIPVVLLFGDGYQLFSVVEKVAIDRYAKTNELWEHKESKKEPEQ